MSVPDSLAQVIAFIALVVPGVTYSTRRRMLVGWQSPDQGPGNRILDALYASVVFVALYAVLALAVFGWKGEEIARHAGALWRQWPGWLLALTCLALLIGIPGFAAYLSVKVRLHSDSKWRVVWRRDIARVEATPRAWDHAALRTHTSRFVRVRMSDGRYYGGWYGEGSIMSMYPHERDIFISSTWEMGEHGEFERRTQDTAGMWIPITDECVVEWLHPPEED